MDSCHFLNFLFGPKRPASEHLAKYLNILKSGNNNSNSDGGSTSDDALKQQNNRAPSQIRRAKHTASVKSSPIKQLQNKLFNNNNVDSNTINTSNHKTPKREAPPVTKRLITAKNNGRRIPSGIFRATTASVDYDDNESECVLSCQLDQSPNISSIETETSSKLEPHTKIEQLLMDPQFLHKHFFIHFDPIDCCMLAQVCKLWKTELYKDPHYWRDLIMAIDCHRLKREYSLQATSEQCSKSHTINNSLSNATVNCRGDTSVADPANANNGAISLVSDITDESISLKQTKKSAASLNDWPSPPISGTPSPQLDELDEIFHTKSNQKHVALEENNNVDFNNNNDNNNFQIIQNANGGKYSEPVVANRTSTSSVSLMSPISRSGSMAGSVGSSLDKRRVQIYQSLDKRDFQAICLLGASDEDVIDFVSNLPTQRLHSITYGNITNSSITNKGVEIFLSALPNLVQLELSGCNDITNSLSFSTLRFMRKLSVTDCINIADGFITRIHQILGQLDELTIQSYHITDASMDYLQSQLAHSRLRVLEMPNCKEITDESIIMIARIFPDLEVLSLSGSTKITDDGIEILAEQAHCLRKLDISWCSRITDAALECVACDLSDSLDELIVDRCIHVTDVGLGYLATMAHLHILSLRWCQQITDIGLETITSMRGLTSLSIAGCHQITLRSLLCLIRSPQLIELELTNCPSISPELLSYLQRNLPHCTIIS